MEDGQEKPSGAQFRKEEKEKQAKGQMQQQTKPIKWTYTVNIGKMGIKLNYKVYSLS